ncbi:hypothetical protein E2C01_003875 [Portunus trituberculatus]|uniref:Secreted protein n=1 Tax=Portunus trituberculatus TaxID=210409 RepID=A0A5B7CRC7_PORTR|nr:hypothetical protein [Portunus trituberculatus]
MLWCGVAVVVVVVWCGMCHTLHTVPAAQIWCTAHTSANTDQKKSKLDETQILSNTRATHFLPHIWCDHQSRLDMRECPSTPQLQHLNIYSGCRKMSEHIF